MKAWIGAAALAGTMSSGGAMADGNLLLDHCQQVTRAMDKTTAATDEPLFAGRCLGMVEGVRNTLVILNSALPEKIRICFPKKGIDNGQAVRIVDKFLRENPAMLDQPDTFLVMMAFRQAYPCNQ